MLRIYINEWLAAREVTLGEEPPWGSLTQPEEPDEPLEKPVGLRGEGPSDALRQRAKNLVDELPALEIPAAVAYLQFLGQHMPSVEDMEH